MNANRPPSFRPTVESLESRQLMAANITAGFADGVLSIEGTDGADAIVVRNNYDEVSVDGVTGTVPASLVKAIVIESLGGNDIVRVSGGNYPLNALALVDAGAGNDVVFGGNADNAMDGGDGDDVLLGSIALDLIFGGAGNDTILGLAGDDVLFGQAGSDTIYGADGHDILFGNDGADWLYGGNGVDILHGGAGADALLGEAGNDFLFFDLADVTLHFNRLNVGQSGAIETTAGTALYYNGTDAQLADALNKQMAYRISVTAETTATATSIQGLATSPTSATAFQSIKKLFWTDQLDSNLSGTFDYQNPTSFWMAR